MCLIQWLGFLPNLEKSELMPRAELTFLGTSFNLRKGTASPSPERINKVVRLSKLLMGCTTVKVHLYLQLLRLMASCIAISPWERLRMRPLQLHLLVHWNAASINMEERIPITKQVFSHLQWRTSEENLSRGPQIAQKVIITDASKYGWGAHFGKYQTAVHWEEALSSKHINWLELEAVFRGLQAFLSLVQGCKVLIRSDKSTVVAYLNKQGGTQSPALCALT
ncbi:hypothetical protein HOLleu_31928 [Holothuria leucospilota]|uniref:RNase H type-1 domain-containing protein n=1 Tax=Holothuria leucospilota TaxID=206669 RepID=A0A9Q0YSA6_HOLLE|nr:hypothetical protein HOLleu_31928 [Holothuria leucospilota]